jgi:hypothetical protein
MQGTCFSMVVLVPDLLIAAFARATSRRGLAGGRMHRELLCAANRYPYSAELRGQVCFSKGRAVVSKETINVVPPPPLMH